MLLFDSISYHHLQCLLPINIFPAFEMTVFEFHCYKLNHNFNMASSTRTRARRRKTDFETLLGSGKDQDGFKLYHINEEIGQLIFQFTAILIFTLRMEYIRPKIRNCQLRLYIMILLSYLCFQIRISQHSFQNSLSA